MCGSETSGTHTLNLFQESSLAQQTFAAVAEAVQQLNAHTVSKLSAVPGMTPKTMARADLHDRLEAISQTARVIAEQTPDLEEKFVLPKVLSNQALLMTARAFAHDAEPIADRFIAHVMPKAFLADLEAAIGRFAVRHHPRDLRIRASHKEHAQSQHADGKYAHRSIHEPIVSRVRDSTGHGMKRRLGVGPRRARFPGSSVLRQEDI